LRWLRWEAEVRASKAILEKFNILYDETIKKYQDIVKLIDNKNKSTKDFKEKNKIYNELIQELCKKYNITSKNIAINSANGKITILGNKE
jgi:predicted RND superfamily exporter protein